MVVSWWFESKWSPYTNKRLSSCFFLPSIWKISSSIISPIFGMNIKNVSNHHPDKSFTSGINFWVFNGDEHMKGMISVVLRILMVCLKGWLYIISSLLEGFIMQISSNPHRASFCSWVPMVVSRQWKIPSQFWKIPWAKTTVVLLSLK